MFYVTELTVNFSAHALSLIFSILNILIWTVIIIPQLYKNYKHQSSKAISYLLVLFWFVGGIFSLMSAVLKSASISIVVISIHHIILDIILMSQLMYYRNKNDVRLTLFEKISTVTCVSSFILFIFLIIYIGSGIGEVLGWVSLVVLSIARVPQIMLNIKRNSVSGLAFVSFVLMMVTNLLFVCSIFVHTIELPLEVVVKNNLQWIIGSVISFVCDIIIMYQFYIYRNRPVLGYTEIMDILE